VTRVAVIGAGIGGLAAACALHANRLDVEVYERAGELGELGAGLQLGPNAVKIFSARCCLRAACGPTRTALAFRPQAP
jgi:salicylate hydroxylase